MSVYELDPLSDERWSRFIDSHSRSSVFHKPEWLEALSRTYKYRPIAFTTRAAGAKLDNDCLLPDRQLAYGLQTDFIAVFRPLRSTR